MAAKKRRRSGKGGGVGKALEDTMNAFPYGSSKKKRKKKGGA